MVGGSEGENGRSQTVGSHGHLILFDTTELKMPTPRKLHTSLAELERRQAAVSPTVALELAANGYQKTLIDGISPAEYALKTKADSLTPLEQNEFERDAWWAQLWRDPKSPYRLVTLTPDEALLAQEIAGAFDRRCFTAPPWAPIAEHRDAKIVAEALAKNAKLLLTSNMRSIKQNLLNDWAERSGQALGFAPQRVVNDADATLLIWSTDPEREDRLLQAALMACWPDEDDSNTHERIQATNAALKTMGEGRLPGTSRRLAERLENHPDPTDLVNRTRLNLPSLTIETDRGHPTYPKRPSGGWRGLNPTPPNTKSWSH